MQWFYTAPACQLHFAWFLNVKSAHLLFKLVVLPYLLQYTSDCLSTLQAATGDAKGGEQPDRREDKRARGVCTVQPKVTRINVSVVPYFIEKKERVKGGSLNPLFHVGYSSCQCGMCFIAPLVIRWSACFVMFLNCVLSSLPRSWNISAHATITLVHQTNAQNSFSRGQFSPSHYANTAMATVTRL